jgi:hypothetical protein
METVAEKLGEVEPQVVETEVVEATETDETVASAETVEATEEVVESSTTETKEPAMVQATVMHGERDRRQSIQKEFEAYKEAHPEQEVVRPDVFDDQESAFNYVENKLSTELTETLLGEGKGEAVAQYGQEETDMAEAWFVTEAVKSPTLANQLNGVPKLRQHRKVVELYKADQVRVEMAEDPAALEARLEAQGVEKYLAAQKAGTDKKTALTDSIPKSLVGQPSEGLNSSSWKGPAPLSAKLGEGG